MINEIEIIRTIREWFEEARQKISSLKEQINSMNRFPVADQDTGSNLLKTISGVLPTSNDWDDFFAELSQNLINSASGNSGLILSPILCGIIETVQKNHSISPYVLKEGFHEATNKAYKSVVRPVEGTMLTLIRELSESDLDIYDRDNFFSEVESAMLKSLERTRDGYYIFKEEITQSGRLERTREPLKKHYIVNSTDAGAEGLYFILSELLKSCGHTPKSRHIQSKMFHESKEDYGFNFEVLALYKDENAKENLRSLSDDETVDSLVIISDKGLVKVHLHTNDLAKTKSILRKIPSIQYIKNFEMMYELERENSICIISDSLGADVIDAVIQGKVLLLELQPGTNREIIVSALKESKGITILDSIGLSIDVSDISDRSVILEINDPLKCILGLSVLSTKNDFKKNISVLKDMLSEVVTLMIVDISYNGLRYKLSTFKNPEMFETAHDMRVIFDNISSVNKEKSISIYWGVDASEVRKEVLDELRLRNVTFNEYSINTDKFLLYMSMA